VTRVVTFRSLFLAIGLLFVVLVTFQLHGFSLSEWSGMTGRLERPEILIGHSRSIRSDDWFVHVPLFLSQAAQRPALPAVNPLIGPEGQSMSFGYPAATREWSLLLRPQLWGFLIGQDTGLSWLWYARVLGLFCTATLFFGLLCRGDLLISVSAALVLLFSPFYQYWSLNTEPITSFVLLSTWIAYRLCGSLRDEQSSWFRRGLWAAGLVYTLSAFAIAAIYPPQQVVLATFAAFAVLGLVWRDGSPAQWPKLRWGIALGVVLIVVGSVLCLFFREHLDQVNKLMGTVYPGRRVSTGSTEFRPDLLFRQNLLAFFGAGNFTALGNICEAGSFVFLAPFVLLGYFCRSPREAIRDPLLLSLAIFLLWVTLWLLVPFPEFFAKFSGWFLVPSQRAVIGLGLGGLSLMVLLATRNRTFGRSGYLVFAVVLVTHFWLFSALRPFWSYGNWGTAFGIGIFFGLLCTLPRPRLTLALWAVFSVASTWWFNPIVRGGSRLLAESPLGQRMLESSEAFRSRTGRDPVWVVYDSVTLANLPRALGLRSLGGTHFVPQFSLWQAYDPDGLNRDVYNRYAHIIFSEPVSGRENLESPSADVVIVYDEKFSARQRKFGVTHLLQWNDATGATIREVDTP